ncbi:MAG: MBL fold metallo-hydrolase [SAR202 cluster bacterium]|nr:MBL fold metallo-hydrolase [SAR202 cluster bacterium]|tara:strand:+ start:6851 stop:7684 length:834 start_codon:yes stop_codon:yes gene_type:complete
MEITEKVHTVDDVYGSNVVLLLDTEITVIDTGFPGNGQKILDYIRDIGRQTEDIKRILITHFHFDHSGSALEIHNLTGASIIAHKDEVIKNVDGTLLLRKGEENEPPPLWYKLALRATGLGRRSPKKPARQLHDTPVHKTVSHGDIVPGLGGISIIHSPGHTPGSISPFVLDPKIIFLGDSVINNIDRLSRPLMWDRAKRRTLDRSLQELRELDATIACFGHGPALTEDVMTKVRGLTDRPYDLPTWQIALKNWRTLRKWRSTGQRPGAWQTKKKNQ